MNKKLLCFGYGYVASHLTKECQKANWQIIGTKRTAVEKSEIPMYEFTEDCLIKDFKNIAKDVTHILISIPPSQKLDPTYDVVINTYKRTLQKLKKLEWVGYLSSTSIYGDHDGQYVCENTPPKPSSLRAVRRLQVEGDWLATGMPVHIFRLAGIYGPNRNVLLKIKRHEKENIIKSRHFFSRIHVDDIVGALWKSMNNTSPGEVYNLADNCPTTSNELYLYACDLLKVQAAQAISVEKAMLSQLAQSFYRDNKRIDNQKLKDVLNYSLRYPDYKLGLKKLFKEIENQINI